MTSGELGFSGDLIVTKIPRARAPLSWRLKNTLRWGYVHGWSAHVLAKMFTRLFGVPMLLGKLSATVTRADGEVIDYGVLGYRVVTTAFVNYMVDQLQAELAAWGDFKFHDSGVGTTAEAAGDTDIETTDAVARTDGAQTEGASANIYKSTGTITYGSTLAITEHGLFNIVTGGILMDRTVFAAVNVDSGDSINFSYELTCTAGS